MLLADVETSVCRMYGTWAKKKIFGKTVEGIRRTTFVIDREGVIRHVIGNARPEDHPRKALEALEKAGR